MKILKILSLTCIFSIFIFTSCKSDDDGGGNPSASDGTMTATVGGENFTGMEGTIVARLASGSMAISGGTSESENLQMIIASFDGVGTYPLNFVNMGTYSYLPDQSNIDPTTAVIYSTSTNVSGNSGEINISSYDEENIQGTFSFTAYPVQNATGNISITNGEFNIEVTTQ